MRIDAPPAKAPPSVPHRRLAAGAEVADGGVHFRVWAPTCAQVEVRLEGARAGCHALAAEPGGWHAGLVPGLGDGARYRYRLDGGAAYPDPASRFQPEGPHGPSQVVDGLRLDATQGMFDASEEHVVALVARRARAAAVAAGRSILVVAENEPQDTALLRSRAEGGMGLAPLARRRRGRPAPAREPGPGSRGGRAAGAAGRAAGGARLARRALHRGPALRRRGDAGAGRRGRMARAGARRAAARAGGGGAA
ncbi:hypothetical protein [Anaeromyxobacter dehalogenans]|uniref:hypothetical protein n=1 Tax=Anaeromyxobacter dehalogenans TaxID=161493 RepID=UPI0002EEDF7B|nr:hypothetical protein [Anaeromyxobacter dehalogenans]